jgi:DNA repair protein RecN (Recombination protein N)
MLNNLRVQNLALVQDAEIEFGPGLNVITGETGAGKSILVGALGLLLGERADKSLVRSGEPACSTEAVFELPEPGTINRILEQSGVPPCEDGQLVIRRVVKTSGSSQNLVNNAAVTLQVLKKIGEDLVDMHGPHDHQSLLHLDAQLDILDLYGHLEKERRDYEILYRRFRDLENRISGLQQDDTDVREQIDILAYRVREIEEAGLQEDEEEQVRQEHTLVGNAQRILELAGGVVGALTEADPSAFELLASCQRTLEELGRLMPEAEGWREDLRQAAAQIQEISLSVSRTAAGIDADPGRLEWLDQRLGLYEKMKRKYGGQVSDILRTLESSKERLRELETRDERLAELEKERDGVLGELERKGKALRKKREKVSSRLAAEVTSELQALGFPHGTFDVGLKPVAPHAAGMDEVEFGFAPNVGEPSRPLRAIASSGEISRVMLATKAVLARHDRIPVLVFDEIDANVGGEMGSAIGRKLGTVASAHQVICITHLPQVAIFGRTHFAVRKDVREGRTYTRVDVLDETSRVEEVARMLGGRDLTSVTLKHAREMLNNA